MIAILTPLVAPAGWQIVLCVASLAFMMILDAPINFVVFMEIRILVYKYARALSRFTGRGLFYMFLGSMVWAKLFDDGISPFIG